MATVRIRIGPADHGRPMTLEEFREAEEEGGYRYELARGILEVTEIPDDSQLQIAFNLHESLIIRRRQQNDRILRIGGPGHVRLWIPEIVSARDPDRAIVFRGTPVDARGRRPPKLVAEVVSRDSERRDYIEKRWDYLVFGILEYWIIDPGRGQVSVLVRRDGPGRPAWDERVYRGDEAIRSELLPDFAGTVAELWVDAELDEDGTDGPQ